MRYTFRTPELAYSRSAKTPQFMISMLIGFVIALVVFAMYTSLSSPNAGRAIQQAISASPPSTCANLGGNTCTNAQVCMDSYSNVLQFLAAADTTRCCLGRCANPDAVPINAMESPGSTDLNGDGIVNQEDISIVRASFGTKNGDSTFNPAADLNGDGVVDITDVTAVARSIPT